MMTSHKIIAITTGLLIITLASLAFTLSFNSLTDLAREHGVSIPPFTPLIIEGAMIVFSLSALLKSLQGEAAYWQWFLIIAASTLATWLNILHAQDDLLSRVLFAVPSIVLLLAFENFLGQIKSTVKRGAAIRTLTQLTQDIDRAKNELHHGQNELEAVQGELAELDTSIADRAAKLDTLTADLNRLAQERDHLKQTISRLNDRTFEAQTPQTQTLKEAGDNARQAEMEARRAELVKLWAEGVTVKAELARRLDVSSKTISRDIEALGLDTEADTEADRIGPIIDALPMDKGGKEALHSLNDKHKNGTLNGHTNNGNGAQNG